MARILGQKLTDRWNQQVLVDNRPGAGGVLATEQVANRGVPSFNTNRADTLASMDRFNAIAKNLNATVIIQHEPADIAKLPAFPKPAE